MTATTRFSRRNIGRTGYGLAVSLLAITLLAPAPAHAAGNVTVVHKGASLQIVGDAANNDIDLSQTVPGELVITGDSGTTVNGQPSETVAGLTGNVIIKLRDGNDRVAALGVVAFPKSLKIDLGDAPTTQFVFLNGVQVERNLIVVGKNGNEMISIAPHIGTLTNPTVGGVLAFRLGGGINSAGLDSIQVGKNLVYAGRAGMDSLIIRTHGDTLTAPVIEGSLRIALGGGASNSALVQSAQIGRNLVFTSKEGEDTIQVTEHHLTGTIPTIGGSATVRLGDGKGTATFLSAQVEKQLRIVTGDGFDQVNVLPSPFSGASPTIGGVLSIELGHGTNFLHLENAAVTKKLKIRGGDDEDSIDINDATSIPNGRGIGGKTSVETGAGEDLVTVDQVEFAGRVAMLLGDADDTLGITDSTFDDDVLLDGGAGGNVLTDTGNFFAAGLDALGF